MQKRPHPRSACPPAAAAARPRSYSASFSFDLRVDLVAVLAVVRDCRLHQPGRDQQVFSRARDRPVVVADRGDDLPDVQPTADQARAASARPIEKVDQRVRIVAPSAYADATGTLTEIEQSLRSADIDAGLRAVARLRRLTEQLEAEQVAAARRGGWSWQEVAVRLGVTKQTVHRKYYRELGRGR